MAVHLVKYRRDMTHDGVVDPTEHWHRRRAELLATDADEPLSAAAWNDLAEAHFWADELIESLDARRQAYRLAAAADDHPLAGRVAWRLFYEHFLVGEDSVAHGWLARCRHHATTAGDGALEAWLAIAEGDIALRRGDVEHGLELAADALAVGRAAADADVTAMALQVTGRARIEAGDRRQGLGDLDEAMVAVINDELDPLFTGWIFCNVIATCYSLGDLRRATEWSDAAMRWCSALRDGRLYRGLCRVYAAELACLRGEWEAAEAGAAQAIDELMTHDARYAGEAVYLRGDLLRLRGRGDEAEAAFTEAHRLGRVPQPGLALLRLAEGRTSEAGAAIRSAVASGPGAPLPRARLLGAALDIFLRQGRLEDADRVVDELGSLRDSDAPFFEAFHAAAVGRLAAARGEVGEGLRHLRLACETLRGLGFRYDMACGQLELAILAADSGDNDTARMEFAAALAGFESLGAHQDAERARAAASSLPSDHASDSGPLTERELDVLRLVGTGMTNRQIARDLNVSHHTVGRHLSNIFIKLGVRSRAAATASAIQLGLVDA